MPRYDFKNIPTKVSIKPKQPRTDITIKLDEKNYLNESINTRFIKKIDYSCPSGSISIQGLFDLSKVDIENLISFKYLTLSFSPEMKSAYKQEFDSQPHPKINHNNMSLIKEYKDILSQKKNDYYSILLSSIIIHCAFFAPNCQSTDVIYPGFLISLEVIKKKLECEKNHFIPDENIYKVKLDEKTLEKNLEIFASGGRENGFVLDCINKQKSQMKDYVSLYDYHLKTYFTSEAIRKELKSKG